MNRSRITDITAGVDSSGTAYDLATVSVLVNIRSSPPAPATVYAGPTGERTAANPLTFVKGALQGWLDEGVYDLVPTVGGVAGEAVEYRATAEPARPRIIVNNSRVIEPALV